MLLLQYKIIVLYLFIHHLLAYQCAFLTSSYIQLEILLRLSSRCQCTSGDGMGEIFLLDISRSRNTGFHPCSCSLIGNP